MTYPEHEKDHWFIKMFHPEIIEAEESSRLKKFWHSVGKLGLQMAYPFFDGIIKHAVVLCSNCRKRFGCIPWMLYLSGFRIRKFYKAVKTVLGNCEKWTNGGMSWSFQLSEPMCQVKEVSK